MSTLRGSCGCCSYTESYLVWLYLLCQARCHAAAILTMALPTMAWLCLLWQVRREHAAMSLLLASANWRWRASGGTAAPPPLARPSRPYLIHTHTHCLPSPFPP